MYTLYDITLESHSKKLRTIEYNGKLVYIKLIDFFTEELATGVWVKVEFNGSFNEFIKKMTTHSNYTFISAKVKEMDENDLFLEMV